MAVSSYGALMSSTQQHSTRLLMLDATRGTLRARVQRPCPCPCPCPYPYPSGGGGGGGVKVQLGSRRIYAGARAMMSSGGGGEGGYMERALGAVGYVLPLLDGMQYGRYVFAQYPASEALFRPLFPLLRIYSSIPFSNFVLFFTLYLALVRNPSFGRFVRFNAMQACVLDVLVVLPLIAQRILSPRSGLGLDLLIVLYNTIFIGLLAAVVFAVVSCLLGKTLRLPIVADAAENQLF